MRKILVALLGILLALSFAACSDDGPEITISLNETEHVMDISESFTLVATTNSSQEVTWTSSDEAVATVAGGVVTPVSRGETQITAAVEDATAVCKITVVDRTIVVSLTLTTPGTVNLWKGDTFTVVSQATYDGAAVDAAMSYSSDNAAVASVSESGVITAASAGTANITVTASYADTTDTETIAVTVSEKVVFAFEDESLSLVVGASQTPRYTLKVGDTTPPDAQIAWSTSNAAVATVNDAGLVTAAGEGTAVITAKYGENTIELSVTVTLTQNDEYKDTVYSYYDLSGEEFVIDLPFAEGAVSASLDGVNGTVAASGSGTAVTFKSADFTEKTGERMLTLKTGSTQYEIKVVLATKIIDSVADWNSIWELSGGSDPATTVNTYDGYYVLGADLDFLSNGQKTAATSWTSHVWLSGYYNNTTGFVGVLDGRGYTVRNYACGYGGALIPQIGINGVVKNLVVEDVDVNSHFAGAITVNLNGTIENVLIKVSDTVTLAAERAARVACTIGGDAVMNNCILIGEGHTQIQSTEEDANGANLAGFGHIAMAADGISYDAKISNCYMISTTIPAAFKAGDPANGTQTTDRPVEISTTGSYTSAWAFKQAGLDLSSFDGVRWFQDWYSHIGNEEVVFSTTDGELTLYIGDGKDIAYTLTVDGAVPENAEIVWSADPDGTVVTVSESGRIETVAAGNAVVTGTFTLSGKDYTITCNVEVKELEQDTSLASSVYGYYDLSGTDVTVEISEIKNAVSASVQGAGVSAGVQGGADKSTLTFESSALQSLTGEQVLLVQTATTQYQVKVVFADKVINTVADWNEVLYDDADGNVNTVDVHMGYYVLGAPLDFEGASPSGWFSDNWRTGFNQAALGFAGTLDGRGFTISNITCSYGQALIPQIAAGGVVKNLVIENAAVGAHMAGAVAVHVYGTVENVFASVALTDANVEKVGKFANTIGASAVMKNCIVIAETSSAGTECIAGFGHADLKDGNVAADISNCYMISTSIADCFKGSAGQNATDGIGHTVATTGRYETEAAFKQAVTDESIDVSSFDGVRWFQDWLASIV